MIIASRPRQLSDLSPTPLPNLTRQAPLPLPLKTCAWTAGFSCQGSPASLRKRKLDANWSPQLTQDVGHVNWYCTYLCASRMTSKTNFRLTIDSNLLRDVETLVAREGTSINALMTELLEDRVKKEQDHEQAKQRALARLREGFDLGGRPFSRDEIHER